ncbi:MAG: hypothetical protein AAGI48_17670 [Verrucomicrobiota bacterium]
MKTPLLNPVLTGIGSRFMAGLPLVGRRIAPIVPTQLHSAAYYVYDTSNFVDVPTDIRRSPSAGFKRLKSQLSDDTFLCKDYGIEEPLDQMEIAMYASIFSADRSGMERAIRVVALNHEIRVRDLARAATQTSTPTVKWNAGGSSIVADIQAAKNLIRSKIGVLPNLLTLPYNVYIALRNSDEIKDYFVNSDGLVTKAQLESVLEVEIQVSGDLINTAAEGQDASIADVWEDEAFLSYSVTSADIKSLNFARTYNWTALKGSGTAGISTYTYDQDEIDSRVVRARQFTDEKVVADGAGYYFSNVLA